MRKRFEDILDICLERITRGESVELCLASYPEEAAELEPLLRVALSVTEVSSIEPRPEFKNAAKYRLLSALEAKEEKRARRRLVFWGWQRRWATVVAAVLVVILIGGSAVMASANSLPGDTLYPVKTATEKARVFLTPGDETKASLHIKFAECRLREMEALVEAERPIPAPVLSVVH
jgi:anti-sigma-K factor RskA